MAAVRPKDAESGKSLNCPNRVSSTHRHFKRIFLRASLLISSQKGHLSLSLSLSRCSLYYETHGKLSFNTHFSKRGALHTFNSSVCLTNAVINEVCLSFVYIINRKQSTAKGGGGWGRQLRGWDLTRRVDNPLYAWHLSKHKCMHRS